MKRRILMLAVLLTCCSGCRPFFGMLAKVPEVESVKPDAGLQSGDSIAVQFSCDMDKTAVESAFRLSCGTHPVNGSFTWNSPSEMVFFPEQSFTYRSYVLDIAYTARSAAGVPMQRSFTRFLAANEETPPLELVSISPDPDDLLISPEDTFQINFNQAVDRISFYSAFSMNPQLQGDFEWSSADSSVRFIPQQGLTPEIHYQLEISADCRSAQGQLLRSAVQRHYRVSGAQTLPVESFCCSTESGERLLTPEPDTCCHLNRNEELSVLFSDAVPPSLHSAAVSLQPAPGIDCEWNQDQDRLTLHMRAAPPPATVVRLKLGTESYYLQWDGAGTEAITLAGLSYCNDTASAAAEYRRIYLNDLLDFDSSDHAALELACFHSAGAEISATALMDALEVYTSNGAAILRLTDLKPVDQAECSALNDLHPDSLFRLKFSIQRYPQAGLLHLRIAETLEDSLGNTPARELSVSYNL